MLSIGCQVVRYLQIVGRELNMQTCKEVLLFHFLYVSLKVAYCTHYSKVSIIIIIINNELSCLFSAILADSFLLFSLMDRAKLCYVYLNKKPSLDFKKLDKLSTLEPKVPEIWVICILYVMCFNYTINSTHGPPSYPF